MRPLPLKVCATANFIHPTISIGLFLQFVLEKSLSHLSARMHILATSSLRNLPHETCWGVCLWPLAPLIWWWQDHHLGHIGKPLSLEIAATNFWCLVMWKITSCLFFWLVSYVCLFLNCIHKIVGYAHPTPPYLIRNFTTLYVDPQMPWNP